MKHSVNCDLEAAQLYYELANAIGDTENKCIHFNQLSDKLKELFRGECKCGSFKPT